MIPLHATGIPHGINRPVIGRVHTSHVPFDERAVTILATSAPPDDLARYAGFLTTSRLDDSLLASVEVPAVHALQGLAHLSDGDVVRVDQRGGVRTLYRKASLHNSILVTEQCNSYCLMCSQPPKPFDDSDRVGEHLRLLDLIDSATESLGITGGEPTLLGNDFLRIIAHAKACLPATGLHVLTNGRQFAAAAFARALAEIGHPNLMLGIPPYADVDTIHDFVVQARGAFDETMRGLHHLARHEVPVEIRVVLHRETVPRLVPLARYLYRNLPFASHVALMGLEWTGFTLANQDLWIDPWEYRDALVDATFYLADRGMDVSIYNHQLCTLPEPVWPFARQSISDWKRDYHALCADCAVRDRCGGFFTWNLSGRISSHIQPLPTDR